MHRPSTAKSASKVGTTGKSHAKAATPAPSAALSSAMAEKDDYIVRARCLLLLGLPYVCLHTIPAAALQHSCRPTHTT